MFFAEMSAARFVALKRVHAHQFAELEKVSHPSGTLQRLVKVFVSPGDAHIFPEFLTQLWNLGDGIAQARGIPGHAALVPQEDPQLAVERIKRSGAVY